MGTPTGNTARQMAGAPLRTATNEAAPSAPAAANRYAELFGAVAFVAEPIRKPYLFPKDAAPELQTAQTGLAEVAFPKFGNIPGNVFTSCRIVKRVDPKGVTTVALVMPSVAIGPVRHPIINVKKADESIQKEYLAFQEGILSQFYAWRKAAIAGGHVDAVLSNVSGNAQTMSAEQLAELGLV